ncbi:ATP synthase F1 subunit gamma [Aquirufa sp.]|jgi:F-type H+-transporting ATPase subunit gamma|uniref:ATP synthase F1 subunit gamma n=1 Tax=Aquirufa sp. TaxID=2676249 RepID=UPI003782D4F6
MASLKEVRNRIVSVNSTQQITKAMKMVSAAKLRRAQDAIHQMRPYAKKLAEMIATVSAQSDAGSENPFTEVREIKNALIIVVTSDRGLCGAFNANVAKATMALVNEKYASLQASGNVEILALGKKGGEYLSRRGYKVNDAHADIFTRLNFSNVREIGEIVLNAFTEKQYDVVEVLFNFSKNVATQIIQTEQLLPLVASESGEKASSVDYIFEPTEEEIISELIPKSIKLSIFRALLESNSSEHGARMTAMDKATENAGELIKALKLEYNRSRQAAITKEILEIVGGAEALSA